MIKLSVDQLKKTTMDHFGFDDPKDVEFITEDYLKLKFKEIEKSPDSLNVDSADDLLQTSIYCHNVAYDLHYYYFEHGGGAFDFACSHQFQAMAPVVNSTHQNLGKNCSHGGGQHSQIVLLRLK